MTKLAELLEVRERRQRAIAALDRRANAVIAERDREQKRLDELEQEVAREMLGGRFAADAVVALSDGRHLRVRAEWRGHGYPMQIKHVESVEIIR